MKTKLYLVLISIVFGLLLTACAAPTPRTPAAPDIQTAIAQTETAKPTIIATSTSTVLPSTTPTIAPSLTPEPTSTATPPTGFTDVRRATVRIEIKGSLELPEFGSLTNVPWVGSGFIISPDGIVVTNNHVVAGASLIKVWLDGEDQPRYAHVLGTSECSDLAVIDIDGEGFHYLEWYNGALDVGLDVYATGYPGGEREYSITRGIISSLKPQLSTSWGDVLSVLAHDAHLSPGNSGGPLVTMNGQVIGINYASSWDGQHFAINARDALVLLDALRAGQNVHSIGINGEIIQDWWSGYGLWVASVEPGSPADVAGLRAGDLVTNFGGLSLGEDETLGTYCDVLRSHAPTDVINFEALRDGQTWAGQLNRVEPLPTSVLEVPTLAPEPTSDAFQTVRDDSGSIEVSVPDSWTDIDGSPWFDDFGQEIGFGLSASPDLISWSGGWDTPGVFIGVSSDMAISETVDSLLDNEVWEECQFEGRHDYEDTQFTGAYDTYVDCGRPGGASLIVLAAQPKESTTNYLLVVQLTLLVGAESDIFEDMMRSLIIQT